MSYEAFCAIDSKEREWSEHEIHVMQELTLSVMTEINLRGQVLKLKAEQDLREMFIATLTHDLRTPLQTSKLSAQLLGRKFAEQVDVQTIVSRIERSMTHADRMIQDLLDVSQIKSGKPISIQVVECDPVKIVREVIEEVSGIHGGHFELEAANIRLEADPVGLRRIVENLATNAIKYGASGEPARIFLLANEDQFELHVENRGSVISEEEQHNIFAPFHRSTSAIQGTQKGWGIGLSLVRGIAQAHGGDISVYSSPERTCFTVSLPLHQTPRD